MHPPPAARSGSLAVPAALIAAAAAVAFAGLQLWLSGDRLEQLAAEQARTAVVLQQVLGEVTRLRIEQSAGKMGPDALLEKLRTYAPLMSSARTTQPDYENARKEMEAIFTAFASIGRDAWGPIMARLAQLKPERDHDEICQLLRAAVRVDKEAGVQKLKNVLLGLELPSPKLRWFAANRLRELDKPLAQAVLRQILMTESRHGVNPDRAAANAPIPDAAALATTGYHNFVTTYVECEDPKQDDTLLMVIGRVEHDRTTIQECIKALGSSRCARAVEPIQRLYEKPPLQVDDPLFLNYCLDALVDIQGAAAKTFLEAALPKASHEVVAKRIQHLLNRIATGQVGAAAPPKPQPPEKK